MCRYVPICINIPCAYASVEARRHQKAEITSVFDVLNPIGMPNQRHDALLHITKVPQTHGLIVRAGRKQTRIQEPRTQKRSKQSGSADRPSLNSTMNYHKIEYIILHQSQLCTNYCAHGN